LKESLASKVFIDKKEIAELILAAETYDRMEAEDNLANNAEADSELDMDIEIVTVTSNEFKLATDIGNDWNLNLLSGVDIDNLLNFANEMYTDNATILAIALMRSVYTDDKMSKVLADVTTIDTDFIMNVERDLVLTYVQILLAVNDSWITLETELGVVRNFSTNIVYETDENYNFKFRGELISLATMAAIAESEDIFLFGEDTIADAFSTLEVCTVQMLKSDFTAVSKLISNLASETDSFIDKYLGKVTSVYE
jgi:hypothetical protein